MLVLTVGDGNFEVISPAAVAKGDEDLRVGYECVQEDTGCNSVSVS